MRVEFLRLLRGKSYDAVSDFGCLLCYYFSFNNMAVSASSLSVSLSLSAIFLFVIFIFILFIMKKTRALFFTFHHFFSTFFKSLYDWIG